MSDFMLAIRGEVPPSQELPFTFPSTFTYSCLKHTTMIVDDKNLLLRDAAIR